LDEDLFNWTKGEPEKPKTPTKRTKKPSPKVPKLDYGALLIACNQYLSRNYYNYKKMKARETAPYSQIVRQFERIKKVKEAVKNLIITR